MTAETTRDAAGDTPSEARAAHPWRPGRFMVIAAHPDDAEFGPSGTAARWIAEGSVGWLVCCTSGDQGGEDPDADPLELAALREREQRAAAAVTGYAGVSFLHQPDGALANDLALRELLVREIRTFRPDAVLATDPETLFHGDGGVNHTDHRAAGLAAVDAVYPAARNPMAFPLACAFRAGGARRPAAVPLLVEPRQRVGRHLVHARPQARGAVRAPQPDPRPRRVSGDRIRDWAAEEGAVIGVARRRVAPRRDHRRRRGRGPESLG